MEVAHFSEIEEEFIGRVHFVSPDHENFGLLRLTPWRIALVSFPAESHYLGQRIWRQRSET